MSRVESALLIMISALFCWPYLIGGGIVGNAGDIYLYAAPFRFFAAKALQSGELPLWNPSIFAGAPFQASPQSALFYPLTVMFYSLKLAPAFNYFCAFHIFMNAAGMYLLSRSLKLSRTAALACGLAWAFSFFFLSKPAAGHAIHLSGYSWTPWILLLGLRLLGAWKFESPLIFAALAAASALQFFSGHVQVWLFTTLLFFALSARYIAVETRGRARRLSVLAGFTVCFIGISAAQLFPTLSFVNRSTRSSSDPLLSEANAYQFATSYSMRPKDLWTLVQPQKFGSPVRNNYEDPDHPSTYFETQSLYMGKIFLMVSAAGMILLIARKAYFVPAAALFFLLLAFGGNGPIYPVAWKALSFQRVPARFYLMVLFSLCLAGAYFWHHALRKRRTWIKAVLLTLITLELYAAGRAFIWMEDPSAKLGRSEAIAWMQERQSYFPARVFTAPEIGNPNKLMFFGLSNVNGYEAVLKKSLLEYFLRTQPGSGITTTGIDVNGDNAALRLFSARHFVSPRDRASLWPEGYHTDRISVQETDAVPMPAVPVHERVSFPDRKEMLAHLMSDAFDPSAQVLSIGTPGTETIAPTSGAKLIKWTRLSGDALNLTWRAASPFWMFLSESFDPGWKAWDHEGKRMDIFEADGYFQGARILPPGTPTVRLYWRFRPNDFILGGWLSALMVLILSAAGMLTAARLRPRR